MLMKQDPNMPIRLLTDVKRLAQSSHPGLIVTTAPDFGNVSNFRKALKYFALMRQFDYVLLDFSTVIYYLGLLRLLAPWRRCKVASLDAFITHPDLCDSLAKKLVMRARMRCLKGVDRIFLYSRNNAALSNAYRIAPEKLTYVPFKVNAYDLVTSSPTGDSGYIFSGGMSRRDYPTLIKACEGLPYPVKIVVPAPDQAQVHSTFLDESTLPVNVKVIHDDGSLESFIGHIAQARLVVIPTKKRDFASTGTSVYLTSMALGKCVIISAGPTSDEILSDGQAVIVPPEDPRALREAIQRVYEDDGYRCHIAQTGREYALSLGGEERFFHSLLTGIAAEFGQEQIGSKVREIQEQSISK
jgi:glycosyltransferase involved in cell wall biosynthesis